jgi:hypothetical protein
MTQAERDRLVALKKAKKKLIYTEGGSRRTGNHGKTRAASAAGTEAAWRPSGGARSAGTSLQPQDQCGYRTGGGGDPVTAGVPGIWADAGRGVLSQETRHRGESGDGAAMDDGGQAVARAEAAR